MGSFAYVCYNETMRKIISGFTIVELLVVIAVIGILTTISLISFTRYQADSRDTQRSSKTTILAEALEKYYDKNGEYPGCSAVSDSNAATVTTTVLPGVELNTLLTPKSAPTDTNSIKCTDITGAAGEADVFAYVGDGSTACTSGQSCLSWTLKYKEESTGLIKSITSRRTTSIATAGDTTLTSTGISFTQINLSWTTVDNALSYTIQRATNNLFTVNMVQSTSATTSASATGLTAGTIYYFRVMPNATGSTGNWSNTASTMTGQLATPVATATTNSTSQITLSWGAVSLATSYTVNRSLASTFTTPTVFSGITATSSVSTGLTPGTTYYFRVQALATSDTSDWSATKSATTTINPPAAAPSVTAAMSGTTAIGTASVVTCAAGTPQYQLQYRSTSTLTNGAWSAWTAWSTTRTMSVATTQGRQYGFEAHAYCQGTNANSTVSALSNIGTTISQISTPAAPTYSTPASFYSMVNAVVNYVSHCAAGTSLYNGTYHTRDWYGGNWGPHPFGYSDSWQNYSDGLNHYVSYWGKNQCKTSWDTSNLSAESYNSILVHPQ